MGRLRTAYLREMGIDVWVLRENVAADGVALSRLDAQAPSASKQAIAAAPEIKRASAPEVMPPSGRALALPTESPAVSSTAPSQKTSAVTGKSAGPNDGGTISQVVADPEFLMCLLDFVRDKRKLSCLFLLPYSAKGLPPAMNRFAADLAIGCLGGPCEPRRTDLRWPMVKSSHIAQSAEDAKQVVISKVMNCGSDVLVFGPAALVYCGIELGPTADPAAAIAAHGKRLWPLKEVDYYCHDDAIQAKKSLWSHLIAIRAQSE